MIRTGRSAWKKAQKGKTKREYLAEFERRRREAFRTLKSQPCVDCAVQYPPHVMQFDHVPGRGEKLFSVGALAGHGSWTRLLAEIEKCDLVCANCHAERTHSRRNS